MPGDAGFMDLGRRILETLLANRAEFGRPVPVRLLERMPARPDLPQYVLDSEAGLVLGEPPRASLSLALPVGRTGTDGLAFTFGHSMFSNPGGNRQGDFLQILLVESYDPVTRPILSGLASLRSLTGVIPGYLAHSVDDQTTARIHRDLTVRGLTPEHLAAAHLAQARARGFSGSVFVAVGIPTARALELMGPYVAEFRRLQAGLSAVTAGGEAAPGCNGRTCADCDEKDVCDRVRAVLKAYEQGRRGGMD